MDRRERMEGPSLVEGILAALTEHQGTIWTALPGIITKVNLQKMTVEVEPSIQARVTDVKGNPAWVKIPVLVDVPIIFPSGGGFTLTFPVAVGDEALVIFASRCIDAWWQLGGVQVQAELRMHSLSDGFAMVGPRSQNRLLSPQAISGGVQLRNDSGSATISINTGGGVVIEAATITLIGDVAITGALTNNGKNVGSTHTHGGVQPGGGTSGVPT